MIGKKIKSNILSSASFSDLEETDPEHFKQIEELLNSITPDPAISSCLSFESKDLEQENDK